MTETLSKTDQDIEREYLQGRLITSESDTAKLRELIGELYSSYPENPHMFYMAAARLTSLTYLERRDRDERIILPAQEDAARAFSTYAALLAMLGTEKDSPLYLDDARVGRELTGAREELAFHATLAYAAAQGADFVALATPASLDFGGEEKSSDLQIFFAGANRAALEIEVKYRDNRKVYHRRIAVLSLTSALDSVPEAVELRGLLKAIGGRPDGVEPASLAPQEHDIIMKGAAAIMSAARERRRIPRSAEI